MVRFFLSFVFTVVAARWIYAEIAVVAPQAMPAINYALENLQIPTHDRWDREALSAMVNDLGSVDSFSFVQTAEAAEPTRSQWNENVKYAAYTGHSLCQSGGCETF